MQQGAGIARENGELRVAHGSRVVAQHAETTDQQSRLVLQQATGEPSAHLQTLGKSQNSREAKAGGGCRSNVCI